MWPLLASRLTARRWEKDDDEIDAGSIIDCKAAWYKVRGCYILIATKRNLEHCGSVYTFLYIFLADDSKPLLSLSRLIVPLTRLKYK